MAKAQDGGQEGSINEENGFMGAHDDTNDEDAILLEVTSAASETERIAMRRRRQTLWNFIVVSVLFASNHGSVVTCLSLATARLGSTLGAWQSGVLYISYTASALLGASAIVRSLGPRNALLLGMATYCLYVACFLLATTSESLDDDTTSDALIILGGIIGGIAASFVWTAQGSYFVLASNDYASHMSTKKEDATSFLGGIFAAIYLSLEVVIRLLSTIFLEVFHTSWHFVFTLYTIIAVASTFLMLFVQNYDSSSSSPSPTTEEELLSEQEGDSEHPQQQQPTNSWFKATDAIRLLFSDAKMKWFIPFNVTFGLASSFVTSFVNGQVLSIASSSAYVGLFTSVTSAVAAIMSIVFAWTAQRLGTKGPILQVGSVAFGLVALGFVLQPRLKQWTFGTLFLVYLCQGVGRATFESTLRATFADFFPTDKKEAAFANIILQNGLSSAIGFVLSIQLRCFDEGLYCIKYEDGSLHNVLIFEVLIIIFAILAIVGYFRASQLYSQEQQRASSTTQDGYEGEVMETNSDAVMT